MRRPSNALIVAAVAVGFSVTGTAVAHGLITSGDIRNHTIQLRDISPRALFYLRGQRGPAGPRGPVGRTGAARAGRPRGPHRRQGGDGPDGPDRQDGRDGCDGRDRRTARPEEDPARVRPDVPGAGRRGRTCLLRGPMPERCDRARWWLHDHRHRPHLEQHGLGLPAGLAGQRRQSRRRQRDRAGVRGLPHDLSYYDSSRA